MDEIVHHVGVNKCLCASYTPNLNEVKLSCTNFISERAQSCSCSIEISDMYVYIYIYVCGRTSSYVCACSVVRIVGGVKCQPLSKA